MLQPGLLIQQVIVSSLEVARVIIGCQQYTFVVTNDYRFFSSSEMFLGASTNPTVYAVMSCYFTLQAGHCLFRGQDFSYCKFCSLSSPMGFH